MCEINIENSKVIYQPDFYTWAKKFENEDSNVGKFVRDMLEDKEFPKNNNFNGILGHLFDMGAQSDYIEGFIKAWELYKEEMVFK